MAFQIRVVPDALRQSSEQIDQIISENDQIYSRLKVITSKLDDSWDGTASEFMVKQVRDLIQYPNKAKEGFEESKQVLQNVVQAFEDIDNGEGKKLVAIKLDPNHFIKVGPDGNPFSGKLPLASGHIRVIPDGLREAAHEAQSVTDITNEISTRIDKVLSDLQSSWEGKAYNKFSDRFSQIREVYNQLTDALEQFSQRVIAAANRYEEIDNLFD